MKIIGTVGWASVVVLGGLLLGFSGFVPGTRDAASVTASTTTGKAAIGGPFRLTTHQGEPLTNEDLSGKPYLLFFGFTHCPDVCPTTLYELTGLLRELGPNADRLTPLFVTVDPERDTQDLLASYMTSFDERILALRGTPEQTQEAVKAFAACAGKVLSEGGRYTMEHTAGVYMMGADGSFMGMLDMHEPEATRLEKLRRLANSAARNQEKQ